MKKIFALIISVVMLVSAFSFAYAESSTIDFSGMTFEELMEVQQQLTLALWKSGGWQKVKVPVGVYEVGKDIPAGTWTVSYEGKGILGGHIEIYKKRANDGSFDIMDFISLATVKDEPVNITVLNGNFIEISYDSVIFSTSAGLGFNFS